MKTTNIQSLRNINMTKMMKESKIWKAQLRDTEARNWPKKPPQQIK